MTLLPSIIEEKTPAGADRPEPACEAQYTVSSIESSSSRRRYGVDRADRSGEFETLRRIAASIMVGRILLLELI